MAKYKKKYKTVKVPKRSYDDAMWITEYAVKRGIGNELPAKVEKTLLSDQRGEPITIGSVLATAIELLKERIRGANLMEGSRRRGGFRREFGTGEFVRNYLRENGPSRNHVIWQAYRNYCEEHGYHGTNYNNFRSYFSYLKKRGLVELNHVEKAPRGGRYIYYQLNLGRLEDSSWKNPRKV